MPETLQKRAFYNVDKEMEMPNIENGYWFFLDRHSKAIDKYEYSEMFDRASSNYSIVVFDTDSNTLYYYALDT